MKLKYKIRMNESGQGMSEYLILVMLIAVASIAATRGVGKTVYNKLNQIHDSVEAVTIDSVQGKNHAAPTRNAPSGGASAHGSAPLVDLSGSTFNH